MRYLIITMIMTSLFTLSAFAEGQMHTECPMMAESNRRVNTKINLSKEVKKPIKENSSKATGV